MGSRDTVIIAFIILVAIAAVIGTHLWLAAPIDAAWNEIAVERDRQAAERNDQAGERARLEAWAANLTRTEIELRTMSVRELHTLEQARTLAADAGRVFDQGSAT